MLTELIEETLTPKLRGGYYTPPAIAKFLADWVIQRPTDTVLEPSCGDGELAVAAATKLLELGATSRAVGQQLRATELFESEARVARQWLAQGYFLPFIKID
ncbi:MAG TPA: N-6 DNA methylase [Hymenobacter sp.]|uniref:N-6 DNA methylase n=1 Tax=Hymenobacter sp. TaxID=1898978 RepID=UPI002D7FEBEE|nr:N-6 DNA methylase [Hymenobacter sp.]HET9505240.1 N-6 DNA methylase [Hymenobacter sp.]